MVSAFASDGAGERFPAGWGRLLLRPASRAFRDISVLAAAGGHRMTDTLSSTMVPDRCDDAERLEAPFLDGKLQIPRPGFPVLPRPRVHALLDRATRHRVTLVSGPPGAGKTVACASWAALRPAAGRVIWLTVDPADRRDWFWAYVCACVSRVRPAPPEVLQSLEDAGPGGFPMRLVAIAQSFTEPFVLVLDDVHEATDPGVLSGLDVLIRHAPPTLRLVLAARRPPALQLARLRVCGELGDISAADLACTAEEAEAYFAMLGMRLPAAERDHILRRTQGWMAGIRLAALQAEQSATPAGDSASGDTGPGPLVTEYLWDEVLGRQEPRTRAFLARTSVVAEVSGGLADAICAQTGGAATLARLSEENCLVDALGGAAGSYRYHPLLREVLSAELHREFPDEVPVLLGRAARWYAEHDRALDAVRAACAARDWDQAAGVLAGSAVGILMSDGARPLESVLGLFPADRAGQAAVAAAWAAARLWSADAEGAAAYLEAAGRSVERAAAGTRRVVEPVLAALGILRAAEQWHGDPALTRCGWALVSQAQQSAATRAEHRAAGLLWFALGCASLHCWDIAAAARALRHADRQLSTGGLDLLRARARAWRALALACAGELTAAEHAADEVRTHIIPATPEAATLAALGSAQLNLARDDLPAAQRLLDEADGDRAGHVPGEPPVAAIRALIQARVLLADGAPAAAAAALARLREGPPPGCAGLSRAAIAVEVEIALRAGDPGRARALLPPGGAGPSCRAAGPNHGGTGGGFAGAGPGRGKDHRCGGAGPERGEIELARAGLLLAEGDFAAARDAAACLDGAAALTPHERTRALLAGTVAARRLGDTALAATLIRQALALAEPEGAYRVFLDGGFSVRSAVTVLVPPTSRYAGFVGRLLERFDGCGPRLADAAGRAGVRLTDSEHAVLRFLPSHMTNKEISEALFLSVNTVKTHLRSAYRKLGVRSRRDAIARGRRLGLLLPRLPRRGRPGDAAQVQQGDHEQQPVAGQPGPHDHDHDRHRDRRPEDHDQARQQAQPAGDPGQRPARTPAAGGHQVHQPVHHPEQPDHQGQQDHGSGDIAQAVDPGQHGQDPDQQVRAAVRARRAASHQAVHQPQHACCQERDAEQDGGHHEGSVWPGKKQGADGEHGGPGGQGDLPGAAGGQRARQRACLRASTGRGHRRLLARSCRIDIVPGQSAIITTRGGRKAPVRRRGAARRPCGGPSVACQGPWLP
jgi:LuxR family maltose regulon positive regulatory protein